MKASRRRGPSFFSGIHRVHVTPLEGVPLLRADDEVFTLAEHLVGQGCIPVAARADAVHIAVATVSEMEYFLTWNCVHLNNAQTVEQVRTACMIRGYHCPVVCTPEELMG